MTLPRRESAPTGRSRHSSKMRTSSSVEWFVHEPLTPSLTSPPTSLVSSVSTPGTSLDPVSKSPPPSVE